MSVIVGLVCNRRVVCALWQEKVGRMSECLGAILEQASSGDQNAWRTIVERYGHRVFALLRSKCGDPDLAEEIAQSVFCTIAAKIGSANPENEGSTSGYIEQGKFESWLFRIAINRLRDEMRRRKRQAVGYGESGTAQSQDLVNLTSSSSQNAQSQTTLETREAIDTMRQAMQQLPDSDRQILELRHLGGLSYKQIADTLEQPLGTVLARQHRALKKLKSLMIELTESC